MNPLATLMTTLLLAGPALAAEPACADQLLARAQHDLDEATRQVRDARATLYDTDWAEKAALASADERDAVVHDRDVARQALKDARAEARITRKDHKQLAKDAASGTLTCDATTVAQPTPDEEAPAMVSNGF